MIDKAMLKQILPKSGPGDLMTVYLNWSGVGLISALLAERLDQVSGVDYAAHYTDAVNLAIGFDFWLLISSIGALLCCLVLPPIYLLQTAPQLSWLSERLRFLAFMFFLVAYDEGALMIGILLANLMHTSDRAALLTSKSFLFTDVNLLTVLLLVAINSLLWLVGESIYNRQDKTYSGIVSIAMKSPLKYTVPLYLGVTTLLVATIVNQ
jgi:hypothetical protein